MANHGSISFNKTTGAIELTVPQGTKLADALKSLSKADLSALAKLPAQLHELHLRAIRSTSARRSIPSSTCSSATDPGAKWREPIPAVTLRSSGLASWPISRSRPS